jgi:hypothetical protein
MVDLPCMPSLGVVTWVHSLIFSMPVVSHLKKKILMIIILLRFIAECVIMEAMWKMYGRT